MGLGIASEPFIWLDESTPLQEIVKGLVYALSETKTGLPNPSDWKESAKEFLKNIGLKKQSDLYKDSVHVSVLRKNGVWFFTPMKKEGRGFVNVSKEKIQVPEKASIEEISRALEEALNKCE
jgi:hypothetical protein